MHDLSQTVAVVTGGGRGFGRATAIALADRGSNVVLASRNADELAEVAAFIVRETGRKPVAVPTDVSRPGDVDRLKMETSGPSAPPTFS